MNKTGPKKSDERIAVEIMMKTHQAYTIIDMSKTDQLAIEPDKVRAIIKAIKEKERKERKKECRKL